MARPSPSATASRGRTAPRRRRRTPRPKHIGRRRCHYDPWLRPDTSGGCRRFGEFIPPDLREVIPDMAKAAFPQTKDVIPAKDRQRLAADYLRVNPPVASKFNPAATQFTNLHEMFTITKPSNGQQVMQGQLLVTAPPRRSAAQQ